MPADTLLTEDEAAHLLRRAAFGPTRNETRLLEGKRRSAAVGRLLPRNPGRSKGPGSPRNRRADLERLQVWWLKRMQQKSKRLVEKMVLFWHGHFPSSFDVVDDLPGLAQQNATLREYSIGSFRDLVYRVTLDPAMLDFLDGRRNKARSPNENYARELMELFTLGPVDVNGVPNYTQQDVVELARSLTGFRVEFRGAKRTTYVAPGSFDDGDKLLFEGTSFMAQGKLGVEAEDGTPFPPERNVIDILFEHRDSDGRPTIARFVSRKLWESFAYPNPDLVLVDELADVFVASNYVISDLLTAILTHDEFYSARARSAVVRDPVEFVRGTMVALGVRSNMKEVPGVLRDMGMELFNPPGVEGWNQGDTWLSSSRYLARLHFAQDIASSRTARDGYRFQPEKLLDRQSTTSSEIVEDLLRRLQVTVPLGTYQTLVTYLGNADLDDENWVEQKLRGLFVLLLSLPEFQVQ